MPRLRTRDVANPETSRCSFSDLVASPSLLRSLRDLGCARPSPVQMRAIPVALGGDDVIIQAKSGTGKTIAFCSVIMETLNEKISSTQALVLTPTREIALQVGGELVNLSWYMPEVTVAVFIGGTPTEDDIIEIGKRPSVVVGTPGRVLKLLRSCSDWVLSLRQLVLDEADKLLDSNFRPDVTSITELVYNEELQFLAVSATFPPPVLCAAEALFVHVEKSQCKTGEPIMRNLPEKILLCTSAIKKDEAGLAVRSGDASLAADGPMESSVLKGVLHFQYTTSGTHVMHKFPALFDILSSVAYQQAFVFCGDAGIAVKITEKLRQNGIAAAASSGRMDQGLRTKAFVGIKRFDFRVLVCTDLMARGVDVEKASLGWCFFAL